MTPRRRSAFRRNRTVVEGEVLRYGFGTTSVAAVGVVLSSKGVVAIAIRESPDDSAMLADFETRFPGAHLQHDPKAIRRALNAIVEYVERPTGNLALPLDVRGSDFQRRVWGAVMEIPFGNTTTFAKSPNRSVLHARFVPSETHAPGTRSNSPSLVTGSSEVTGRTPAAHNGAIADRRQLSSVKLTTWGPVPIHRIRRAEGDGPRKPCDRASAPRSLQLEPRSTAGPRLSHDHAASRFRRHSKREFMARMNI
jgi:O6-methylguanine-DNA--protein-cysteine methyltransferase